MPPPLSAAAAAFSPRRPPPEILEPAHQSPPPPPPPDALNPGVQSPQLAAAAGSQPSPRAWDPSDPKQQEDWQQQVRVRSGVWAFQGINSNAQGSVSPQGSADYSALFAPQLILDTP